MCWKKMEQLIEKLPKSFPMWSWLKLSTLPNAILPYISSFRSSVYMILRTSLLARSVYLLLGYTALVADWRNTVYICWKKMEQLIEKLPNSCISDVVVTPPYLQTLLVFVYEFLVVDIILSWLDLFLVWSLESILSKYLFCSSRYHYGTESDGCPYSG